ncbi:MAG: hypothetical protein ACT4QF_06670 [Sporichthyaceae bacterium]
MPQRIRLSFAALALTVSLASCGPGGRAEESTAALRDEIGAARTALVAGDERAARDALERFRDQARAQAASGDLNEDDAAVLRTQAERIVADLDRSVAAEDRAASEAAAAKAAAAQAVAAKLQAALDDDDGDDDSDRGKGKKSKGKGRGEDD